MDEWCFREKAESFAERLWRARWRIPDCERALLASGQKNRCEVVHALSLPPLLSFSLSLLLSIRLGADVCAFSRRATLVSTSSLSLYLLSPLLLFLSFSYTHVHTYSLFLSFPFPSPRFLARHTTKKRTRVVCEKARSRGRRNSRRHFSG